MIKISDKNYEQFLKAATRKGTTIEELVAAFISDIVQEEKINSTDEHRYAQQWYKQYKQQIIVETFTQYLLERNLVEDFLDNLDDIKRLSEKLKMLKQKKEKDNEWEKYTFAGRPQYKSKKEFLENIQEDIEMIQDELEQYKQFDTTCWKQYCISYEKDLRKINKEKEIEKVYEFYKKYLDYV